MNLSQFPILSANLGYKGKDDSRMVENVGKALKILNEALGAGQIMNVAFKDMKDYLNRAFERAWHNTVSEIYLARERGSLGRRAVIPHFQMKLGARRR